MMAFVEVLDSFTRETFTLHLPSYKTTTQELYQVSGWIMPTRQNEDRRYS